MDGKRVRAVACGSTHTACLVTRAWVSDDLIKNCMACKTKFSLVNRKAVSYTHLTLPTNREV